jgi:hypothetical protein
MSAKASKDKLDPVAAAIAKAPIGEPETEEERRAVDEARASIAAGRVRTTEEVLAAIHEKRRREEGG